MHSFYRVEFVPCNKQDYYVIEIHVKPGDKNEIYSDGDDKVGANEVSYLIIILLPVDGISLLACYCGEAKAFQLGILRKMLRGDWWEIILGTPGSPRILCVSKLSNIDTTRIRNSFRGRKFQKVPSGACRQIP